MSFSFFKRAFGLRRGVEEKEFDEFLKSFDQFEPSASSQLPKLFKRRAFRFLVVKNDPKKVIFDSSSHRDSPKSLPLFSIGTEQISLLDFVFGSYFLVSSRDLAYSTKVHDLSTTGQILITRLVNDVETWRNHQEVNTRSFGGRRSSPSVSQDLSGQNSLAACLLLNLDWACASPVPASARKIAAAANGDRRRLSSTCVTEGRQNSDEIWVPSGQYPSSEFWPQRIYHMLFEHCAQVSLLVEVLTEEVLSVICRSGRSHWSSGNYSQDSQCVEAFTKSFNQFLGNFRDLLFPRLNFPVWSSLNNALILSSDAVSPLCTASTQTESVASWLDLNHTPLPPSLADGFQPPYHALASVFVRCCLHPLISKGGRENRHFLSQLVTGILMLHPGWVASSIRDHTLFASTVASLTPLHSSGCVSTLNLLLRQMLTQTGCMDTNLDSLGGSIFNCTILTGQSRKYLMAVLYFATYFLRSICLLSTHECVPDLGKADLFDVENQRRRMRVGSKTRRKSGSAASTGGDAHDSGISSQEDLTASVYSVSTGSSPTHASSMALCRTSRLTRDQCRIAEVAAQFMVSREAEAAAAKAASNAIPSNPVCGPSTASGNTRSALEPPAQVDMAGFPINLGPPMSGQTHTRYTEIPLLIEKCVEPENMCSCLPSELYPGHYSSLSSSCIPPAVQMYSTASLTRNGLSSARLLSDSSPSLSMLAFTSRTPSPTSGGGGGGFSPRFNGLSVGAHSELTTQLHQFENTRSSNFPDSLHFGTTFDTTGIEASHSPSVVNHELIGSSVQDHFSCGLVLQATSEQPDSFRSRLVEQLGQWLTLGPLILRGVNLSTARTDAVSHTESTTCHILRAKRRSHQNSSRAPQWFASGLIVNTDSKTVELLTMKQPGRNERSDSTDVPQSVTSRIKLRTSRHSFSQPTSWPEQVDPLSRESSFPITGGNNRRNSIGMESQRFTSTSLEAAPLVVKLLDQVDLMFERTSCPSLALRDIESSLHMIYSRSRVIADLLTETGPSLLQQPERMAVAAGCSPSDLPLLLSTAASYSLPAAMILNAYHSEWWPAS